MRGLIQGYKKGMYKDANNKVTDLCFGTDTQNLIVTVFNEFSSTKFDWAQEIVNVGKIIMQVTDNCQYDEALYEYLTFCYNGENCEIQNMFSALLKKVFQVTTVVNDVVQLFVEGLVNEKDPPKKVEEFADKFGQAVGKLLRYATDFDPSQVTFIF